VTILSKESRIGPKIKTKPKWAEQKIIRKITRHLLFFTENRTKTCAFPVTAPVLHSGESLPGVLHPALEPSAQEGHGPAGASKMIREMKHLCCEERPRELGLFSLEKKKLQGDLRAAFQHLKGPTRKLERVLFTRAWSERTMGNGFKLEEGRFRLD